MTTITIQNNDRELRQAIANLQARIGDPTPAHELVGEYMLRQVDDRFRTETNPQRRPWQPLSPATVAEKLASGKILKILQRTGLMRSTVNYKAQKTQLVVGLTSKIAQKHQQGKGVPRREILGLNKQDISNIREIYQDYLFF